MSTACSWSAGSGTMLVYWRFSPQQRIAEAQLKAAEARKAMRSYDGTDLAVVRSLVGQSLGFALKHVGLVIGPTMLAAVPVVLLLLWMDGAYADRLAESSLLSVGPSWARTWHAPFLVTLSVSSLTLKIVFRIK